MVKDEMHGRIVVKAGSVRVKASDKEARTKKGCPKCRGKMILEHSSDYHQDGIESYDVERCLTCGFERRFNIEWMGLFS